jgi:O-antigen/teichoic acid export membrane protein
LFRVAELLRTVVWIAAVLIALPRGGGLVALSAANLGAAVLGLVMTAFFALRSLPRGTVRRGRSSWTTLRRILSFSLNIFVTQVTGVLYRQMDRIIIAAALTSVLLARYEIASKLQMLAALSLTFTVSAVLPAASSLSVTDEGRDRLKSMFLEGTKYSCGIALPVTITLMIWADDLVSTWVGPSFSSSADYARWFLAWVIPTTATSLGATIVVGMGYVREAMFIGLASAVINLALSIALVGPLGVLGVIVGTLVGSTIAWYPYMRLLLRVLGLTWNEFARRTAMPVLAVCLPWAAAVFVVHLELRADTLAAAVGAATVSIVSGWIAIFFLALGSDERRLLFASTRALVG